MPPSTVPLKRSRINPVSKAKRKRDREQNRAFLDDFRADNPLCMCHPNCRYPASELHEISGGSFRLMCRAVLVGLLHLYPDHHEKIQGEPYARGLARKRLCDPEHYDRREFLRALKLPETALSEAEVEAEIETLTVVR
jgi:hypothetical protein